jgi:hypothetical protein
MSKTKLPPVQFRQYAVTETEVNKAQVLIDRAKMLEEFQVALQPLLRELEDALGYKGGEDVNSWDLIDNGIKWIKEARRLMNPVVTELGDFK